MFVIYININYFCLNFKTIVMECPHCKQKMELKPNNAFTNAETYGNLNRVYTKCCNKLVGISRKITFNITALSSTPEIDDWSNSEKSK